MATLKTYSPQGGETVHNLDEMSDAEAEVLYGRIKRGELTMNSGERPNPLLGRPARLDVAQEAGSVMAPRQGVDPQRTLQELASNAPAEVKAEFEAVRELDVAETPLDEVLSKKQRAASRASLEDGPQTAREAETSPEDASAAPETARQAKARRTTSS